MLATQDTQASKREEINRPEWQKRVIRERVDLNAKVNDLGSFLRDPKKTGELNQVDSILLMVQYNQMVSYLATLDERIERF